VSVSAIEELLAAEGRGSSRTDAQRNLGKLVTAARRAIDEVGVGVTAHEIAERAGVGVGTLYRRVDSREALLEAIFRELLAEIVAAADSALAESDPWRGFEGFATAFVRLRAASCGVNEALGGAADLHLDRELKEIRSRMKRVVERAQRAGAMREDVDWHDVCFALATVVPPGRSLGIAARADQWAVNLSILLDGLKRDAVRAEA
jgi:AcrR family transcriptional regulator